MIALAAFMTGVIVTVVLIRNRKKETGRSKEGRESAEMKEDSLHRGQKSLQGRKP